MYLPESFKVSDERAIREFIHDVLTELVRRHEDHRATPWRIEDVPASFYELMASRIVGFEMRVSRIQTKFKLGQNRPAEDRAGTIQNLERENSASASALAA